MAESIQATIALDRDSAALVRHMLITGLAAHGEILRLQNLCEVYRDRLPNPDLMPVDVTGDASTVALFAEALNLVNTYTAHPDAERAEATHG